MFQDIVTGLMARGIPEHIAVGMATRMRAESGLNPGINEIKPVVPGSRGGYGLNQWTGPRRVAYEKFADARGAKYDDLETQLDFTKWELENTENAAWNALQGTKTPDEAALVYMNKFLRPGILHSDMRMQFPPSVPPVTPEAVDKTGWGLGTTVQKPSWQSALGLLGEALMPQQQEQAPQLLPMQVTPYQPVKRDPFEVYQRFFGSLF